MISMEPAGRELAGLEGTNLAISCNFVVEVRRDGGMWLKATAQIVDGQLECRELELRNTHGQIDRAWLHELGLAAVLQQAASQIAWRLREQTSHESWSDKWRVAAGVVASDSPTPHCGAGGGRLRIAAVSGGRGYFGR